MRRMRSACCAGAATGHIGCRTAEDRDELASPHSRPRCSDK